MGNVKTKRKKWLFTVIILWFVGVIAYVVLNIPFSKIIVFDNLAYVTQAELESLEKDNYFGPFISTNIKENDVINTSSQKEKSASTMKKSKKRRITQYISRKMRLTRNFSSLKSSEKSRNSKKKFANSRKYSIISLICRA